MSPLRWREFYALLRHPAVPPDAVVYISCNPGPDLTVADHLRRAEHQSEEHLDGWLYGWESWHFDVSIDDGNHTRPLRMSDPLP